MNTRSPYGPMVQQQMTSTVRPTMQQQASPVQARPMQYQRPAPQPAQQPKSNAFGGMMSGGGGAAMGSMMSDERSKKEIAQLESANAALTKALSSKAEYPDTGANSSGMQALGQQNAAPSHANFPDAPAGPAAERVAAQNVAMQQQQPQAQGPQPGQSDIRNPWGVKTNMPNMSDLDEAYARMGQGG